MRSLILTPGDDTARLRVALASEADAVLIDLGVVVDRREAARENAARALVEETKRSNGPALIVRLSPLDSGETDRDLDAVMSAAPFAVMLPKTRGAADVQEMSSKLALHEALNALEDGATAIIASIDTVEGLLAAASLRGSSARLIGLAWDAEALSAEVGAEASHDGEGGLAAPLQTARNLTLFAAAAAGVNAIDAAFASGPDAARLLAETSAAGRAGFIAKLALDPAQAAIINEAFSDAYTSKT
jgi:citrate lyase subunit beta/citryl-CoA lyase